MNKPTILFAIVGGIIILGMVLSIFGNQLIFEKLTQKEDTVSLDKKLEITTELDPKINTHGTFAYQILNFNDSRIKATVLDPSDFQIFSEIFDKDSYEKSFEVTIPGTYKLSIEGVSIGEIHMVAVIGPQPDPLAKSIAFISLYILVVGMGGMIAVGIYAIKSRKKSQFR